MMQHLCRLRRDEKGTTVVELALGVSLFLLLFFMVLDFGRLTYNWVMTEKAMQIAARMAAVHPAVCPGVPEMNERGSDATPRFGEACEDGDATPGDVCQVASFTCAGSTDSDTADAIWARIAPLLPGHATQASLRYRYTFDPRMNFLGGPYVPVVTVELPNDGDIRCESGELCFYFASPLVALGLLAGATETTELERQQGWEGTGFPFPAMSVSMPGEDLNLGTNG